MNLHRSTINTIVASLEGSSEVGALFLSGSLAKGQSDAWSDIDFVLVTPGGPTDAIAQLWRDGVSGVGEIVLWRDRTTRPMLINAIIADWTRIDVVILKPDQLATHAQDSLMPLSDPANLYASLPARSVHPLPSPTRFAWEVEEFLRIFGLLHLAIGRREYHTGVLGLFHLRNLLVELLIAEAGVQDRGGVLHLNRLITSEHQALLYALPAPMPQKAELIAAYRAYAAAYLPRARARAARLGLTWPEAFEAATWLKLTAEVGLRPLD